MSISTRICPHCGVAVATGELYCGNCGARSIEEENVEATSNTDKMKPVKVPSMPLATLVPPHDDRKQKIKIGAILSGIILFFLLLGAITFAFPLLLPDDPPQTIKVVASPPQIKMTPTLPPPLFSEEFVDNQKRWDTNVGPGYSSTINHGTLNLTESNHKVLRERLPGSAEYTNFMITTTFTFIKGDQNDSLGLYLRGATDERRGYYIDIYGDGSYDIVKVFLDAQHKNQAKTLAPPSQTPFLHPKGTANTLSVNMKGETLTLVINGQVIKTLTDHDYSSGSISLFVQNGSSSDGIEARFERVNIYPIV